MIQLAFEVEVGKVFRWRFGLFFIMVDFFHDDRVIHRLCSCFFIDVTAFQVLFS